VIFGETQGIKSDFYADNLFRFGGAYLMAKDFQLDTALTFNTKDTPSVFSVNFGASYRLDFHKDKDIDNGNSAKEEGQRQANRTGKNKRKSKKKKGETAVKKSNKQKKRAIDVMTEGFESIAPMITWYNHDYYVKHYEAHGYLVEKSYSESKFPFENVKPEFFKKAQALIKKRYQLTPLKLTKTEEVMPYADKMFDLFNESYASLSSFVAINDVQKAYFKKKFISFVNPEYIKFVVDIC